MAERRVIDVPELEESKSRSYEQCIRVGDRVFVAGQTGWGEDRIVSREFEPQARRCFERIEYALDAAGASMDDLVRMTVFITDMRYAREFKDVRGDVLGENLTTSALIGVDQLAQPEMLVEIESEAVITDD
jgi:enamine deaminase RidA (YjgF/YER057c/UK114 family)